MSTMYVMEAVNLFCGDADPNASKHLTIAELRLPNLEENYADHMPGGSRVGIEVGVGINKLEMPFKLNGHDPQLLKQFGLGAKQSQMFTAYGAILDKKTGRQIESKAIIQGRLGSINPDTFSRGELQGHEYSINEILHYELYFDGGEQIYWDFFTNAWRVGGDDQNADLNRILRIG